jgi:two-component system sensor histidine kinase KdpD
VLAVATAALLGVRARVNQAHVAMVYLLVVQGASAFGGRRLGLAIAGLAFLAFDWLFVPPYGTLAVRDPLDWAILGAFLLTSVVAAQLFERTRAVADAARQRDALRETARIKDEVVASLSHDLRTPLTTIRAMAHDLTATGDERALMIEEEATRLSSMVTDLLDLSRLTSGASLLAPEPNEAEDLIGAALQRVTGTLVGREVRVALDETHPLLFGRFDFAQTLRVLANLLDNAVKYSPASQPIELRVRREGPWLAFSVADRGPGVPPAERERIFEPFYRRAGTSSDVQGAGLGLSIARAIAIAQQGSLLYEAREGGGSVFTLRVPAMDVEEVASS